MGRPSVLYIEADKKNGSVTATRVGGNAVMITEGYMNIS
jgi:predicted PhzF superfamily epimerase YddE/YHI9